jgi:hypothetical protein
MALTDIQISDELQTGAPSIKYTGNEGPQAPMQMAAADPLLVEEYDKYVFEMEEQGLQPMSFEEFKAQAMAGYAYGGIAGADGRRRYGLGSKLKKFVRKVIPNEVADIAVKAAPFVAPFNPLAAGLMSGIGGFDQHGSLSRGLKSGLMTYGGGQLSRVAGGAGPQWGLTNPSAGANASFMNKYLSSPYVKGQDIFSKTKEKLMPGEKVITKSTKDIIPSLQGDYDITGKTKIIEEGLKKGTSGIVDFINKNSKAILLGSMGIAAATAKPQDMQEAMRVSRGTGLDIDKIRGEVQEALAAGEEAWNALKKKYPYLGEYPTKGKAEGGIMRPGFYEGGQSIPSENSIEDARKTAMQDRLGGITDVMKQADLYRQGDVGQMYMAEGGLMNLGGMEKDYRAEGGFVPIGKEEKADDVPARLSVNEFVMTADAVRGMGDGDIDLGAERMEDLMETLEEKDKRNQGASDMFEVSERLSEVVA